MSISSFRGIDRLSIRRLGRVTLLGGRNGVGKTTVLDAVRTYAARGSRSTLHDLLDKREEFAAAFDEGHDAVVSPDFAALFHGRTVAPDRPVIIGPTSGDDDLRIEMSTLANRSPEQQGLFADLSGEAR
ncbi:MAG: hypothetical protein OXF93_08645 [Acidobacteria bacterium]|nr:hypothetical protein [Acidobacteriota bacterium]